jgi:hypothetical protein
MSQLLVILALFFSTIVDGQIILDEPTVMPRDLNHLWELMHTDPDWQDWGNCPDRIPSPWINLEMAGEMFQGKSDEFDGQAFVLLSLSFLDYKNFGICTKGETILFYGRGLREFLLWFNYPEIYFAEGYYEELVNRAFHK